MSLSKWKQWYQIQVHEVEGKAEWTTCDSSSRQPVHTISKTLYVSNISYAYVEIERAVIPVYTA